MSTRLENIYIALIYALHPIYNILKVIDLMIISRSLHFFLTWDLLELNHSIERSNINKKTWKGGYEKWVSV